MKQKPSYELILVRWQDSKQPIAGWVFADELPTPTVVYAETVGFVVSETSDILALAQSAANVDLPDAQFNGIMQIPKRCITDRFILAYSSRI